MGSGCAFVIGNGESRKGFNLEKLRSKGPIYGCNALYRDFHPDVLVSVDAKMIQEVKKEGYTGEFRWENPFSWASGPTACRFAIEDGYSPIFLLGFDLYGIDEHNDEKPTSLNNVYKDTPNYRKSHEQEMGWRGWVSTFVKLFDIYNHIPYYRVGGPDIMPDKWKGKNIKFVDYDYLEEFLAGNIKIS